MEPQRRPYDRPRPEHHRRGDDRLVVWAACARLHRDFRRDAQAQSVLRPVHHDRRLSGNRSLPALRRRPARHCRCRDSRGGRGRDLCRAALFRADESRRRHRVDGVQLRDLDAARTGGDTCPAPSHLSLPAACNRHAAPARAVPVADRPCHHAGVRAWTGGSRASCAPPHPLRPRFACDYRESDRGSPRRDQRATGCAHCLRGRLGGRRRGRLPRSGGRSKSPPCSACGQH